MPCKGICIRYKAFGRYITGHKRCKNCDLFINWDGLWCPCCGHKLRTSPRKYKYKEQLRELRVIGRENFLRKYERFTMPKSTIAQK
jgi:predicted amidophosphoribosyltransferase